jgi:hypothetical protein
MPADEFAATGQRSEQELADQFGVPLEQIAQRREDLADRSSDAARATRSPAPTALVPSCRSARHH